MVLMHTLVVCIHRALQTLDDETLLETNMALIEMAMS